MVTSAGGSITHGAGGTEARVCFGAIWVGPADSTGLEALVFAPALVDSPSEVKANLECLEEVHGPISEGLRTKIQIRHRKQHSGVTIG